MIKTYQQFNEEFITDKHKCPVCGSSMYRTDAGGPDVTLQCSSDEAKFWNFPRGSKEQNESHDHFEKSTTYISTKEWKEISESKSNKKKRTKIKRVSDAPYTWSPISTSGRPSALVSLPTISQIKI